MDGVGGALGWTGRCHIELGSRGSEPPAVGVPDLAGGLTDRAREGGFELAILLTS